MKLSLKRIIFGCICSLIGAAAGMYAIAVILRTIRDTFFDSYEEFDDAISVNWQITIILLSMLVGIILAPLIASWLHAILRRRKSRD